MYYMYSKGSHAHLYSFVIYSSDTNISHIKSYMYWAAWASAFLSQAWHIAWLSLIYQSSRTGQGKTWPIPNIIGVLLDIVERCESKLQIVLKRTISMPHIISHWIHHPLHKYYFHHKHHPPLPKKNMVTGITP